MMKESILVFVWGSLGFRKYFLNTNREVSYSFLGGQLVKILYKDHKFVQIPMRVIHIGSDLEIADLIA